MLQEKKFLRIDKHRFHVVFYNIPMRGHQLNRLPGLNR